MNLTKDELTFLNSVKPLKGAHIIYVITSPNNKQYIGQTTNYYSRLNSYFHLQCKRQRKLYNSFLKYGICAHEFRIIYLSNSKHKDELNEQEIFFIDFFIKKGFELLNIREGGSRGKFSEESKLKMSQVRKGLYIGDKNPNWGKGLNGDLNGMFGKTHTEKSKLKILETKMEKYGELWVKKAIEKEYKRLNSIKEWKEKVAKNMSGKKIGKQPVVQLSELGVFVNEYESMFLAAKVLEIHPSHISKSVRKNKFAPTTRFKFMYKKDYEKLISQLN